MQEWVTNTAIKVSKVVGVSFDTGCKCTRERLQEINAKSVEILQREVTEWTNKAPRS